MATRMQQRRGTALQWSGANPILAAGEIGFESDTNQFKIGDGVNHWEDLSYFKNLEDLGGSLDDYILVTEKGQLNGVAELDGTGNVPLSQLGNLIDGAPELLNTLEELSAAIGDDPAFFTTVGTNLSNHQSDSTNVHGITDTAALATKTYADDAVSTHSSNTTNIHGITNTADLATKNYVDTAVGNVDLSTKQDVVAGVSSTEIGYLDGVTSAIQTQINAKASSTDLSDHASDTTSVHGIPDTSVLVTTTELDLKAPKADPTFTGELTAADVTITGDLTVSGTTTTVSTQDLLVSDPLIYLGEDNQTNIVDLGIVTSFNDGLYQHSGFVRDSSDSKWKLFKGVIDEPTTTVNFAQGSLDDLAVGALEVTTLTVGDVSNTEIGYLNGVTSDIQTQLDAKASAVDVQNIINSQSQINPMFWAV